MMVTIEKLKGRALALEKSRLSTEYEGTICDRAAVEDVVESIEREIADLYREEARGK